MAMNLAAARVVDPVLTQVALGYVSAELIASQLFLPVPVDLSGGKVIQFGKEAFQSYNLRRAPGAATKRIEFAYGSTSYALLQDAVECKVPREIMRDASVMPGLDLSVPAINTGMRAIKLALESDCAALALDASQYASANKITLSGTSKWSNAASDPVAQIDTGREAVRAAIGVYPNTLVLGAVAAPALRNNPAVKDRFKYTSSQSITPEMVARLCNIERVLVGTAVQADDTGAFSDVWGNFALLAYVAQGDVNAATPSYGFTYVMRGHPLVEEPYYDDNAKSWIYPATYERQPVITAPGAAYLMTAPN